MDPREYARRAYVHHRAKASAYATAGDETRAVGHARAAERHRAAAFGDAGTVVGIVAGAVAGAGVVVGALVALRRYRRMARYDQLTERDYVQWAGEFGWPEVERRMGFWLQGYPSRSKALAFLQKVREKHERLAERRAGPPRPRAT
jgi:hypothetical protein